MSISSSLAAGVAGLSANATRLATISDNIANSATFGYRRVTTEFNSLVMAGGEGAYSAGGVRSSTLRLIDQSGPLVTTSNPTDLALSGRGMLPVTTANSIGSATGTPMFLTPTGSFRPDENGYLRSESGLVLMGWPTETDGTVPNFPRDTSDGLEPILVNLNQFAGDPTTRMDISLNLPAVDTEAGASGDPRELTVEYFGNLGVSESLTFTFTPTVPGAGASNEWALVITDTASGGAVVGDYTLTFDDSRAAGGTLLGVADNVGGAYDPATGAMTVTVAGGPIELNIGEIGAPGGLTQLSESFQATKLDKNGSPVGNLSSVEVDEQGFVHALYDIGFTRTIYQVPVVDVPNLNGLTALNYQTYQTSNESGPFFLWNAGEGPTGAILGFTREDSTTDVAAELTQLIQTQRAYSSNAKVIQTVDEMLQETTNIKR